MASLLDLNSDCSDSEDDVDYVPPDNVLSENSGDENSDAESEDNSKQPVKAKNTSKKRNKTKSKGKKNSLADANDETEEDPKVNEEDEKKRVEDLYKSFLEDVTPIVRKPQASISPVTNGSCSSTKEEKIEKQKVKISEEFDFAGETVTVTKEVESNSLSSSEKDVDKVVSPPVKSAENVVSTAPVKRPAPGGLSSVIGALNKKKQKISTLQKSLLDWNNFKEKQGISEELETHNKGKEGYLERQAFLQRSDWRQFELERNLRLSRKK